MLELLLGTKFCCEKMVRDSFGHIYAVPFNHFSFIHVFHCLLGCPQTSRSKDN